MRKNLFLLSLLFVSYLGQSQNVGIGTTTPNASAQLDVSSNNKGVLFPRVSTAERNAIINPATGLMVFDIEKNLPYYFNGTKWTPLGPIVSKAVPPVEFGGNSPTSNNFGSAVGISKNGYAAVGISSYDTLSSNNIGAVMIYKQTNGVWAPIQFIVAPDYALGDNFGTSIDMKGDYLVIGAPNKDVLATTNSGKAYVYKLSGGSYVLDGELTHPSGLLASSYFGHSVAITNNSPVLGGIAVCVSSPGYTIGGTVKGSVSVFRRSAANNYVALNTIGGYQTNENFGISVDIDSNIVVIGSPSYDTTISATNYSSVGRFQVNIFNGTTYSTFDRSIVPAVDTSSTFGFSVAIDSADIIVGGANMGNTISSSIRHYFRLGAANYTLRGTFNYFSQFENTETASIASGSSLGVSKSMFVLGIPHRHVFPSGVTTTSFGLVEYGLIYKRSTSNPDIFNYYTQHKPITNQIESRYGSSVAVAGDNYIISAINYIAENGNFGAVFFGSVVE